MYFINVMSPSESDLKSCDVLIILVISFERIVREIRSDALSGCYLVCAIACTSFVHRGRGWYEHVNNSDQYINTKPNKNKTALLQQPGRFTNTQKC